MKEFFHKLIYKINGLFESSFLTILIPQRKIGTSFRYSGKTYVVVPAPQPNKLGCCIHTTRTEKYCAFADCCGYTNILKRGYCAYFTRKDKTSVAFKELN